MADDGEEAPLDPAQPIIDPHLHLWEIMPVPGLPQAPQRFLFDECRAAIEGSGQAVTHSVFVECHQMYRADGPAALRCVGETEFANGIAAMSASGLYGPARIAHRIVASADLRLGAAVEPVLDAHAAAAGERFRGVRMAVAWSAAGLFGYPSDPAGRGIMPDPAFVAGARVLAARDLSLDVWCLHTQLGELIALADAVPGLMIVLDHCATLDPAERDPAQAWRDRAAALSALAERPNVVIKLGGLGMRIDRPLGVTPQSLASADLAQVWRPMIESAVAAFGPARCMFESNFPPDRDTATYGATWNAFKRIAVGYADAERDALFRATAARVYRIETDDAA